jgi:hypothetical protein
MKILSTKVRRKPSSLDNDLSESTSIIPCTASDDSPVEVPSQFHPWTVFPTA